ncbi:hypothetical protein PQ796_16460 [Priestia megaterium]|uniref:hypothetical protein n=1 Tax=Priestia megaterium TaxID=1404 RepID=UPI00244C5DDE|nr:hypothetical protein [Priestia megaterium]MDH2452129.1 hypothetical protein [Priestia megaterium]MDL5151586.1 hypothetical protein [Priestia megaterium]MED4265964.1 hypothetical protein [Priestia megaterium]MED4275288.1 hypothetical protein [Priestia megaterium]MED4315400.1 hypothetical protein [Priestia megaterium]
MKFNYSSMYVRGKFESIEDVINKFDPAEIQLHLDSNICIYLRDFYREPSKTISNEVLWDELKKLLRNIEQYDIEVDYSLGVEESCRNLNNFEINEDKLNETINILRNLFDMDFLQMLEHSKLIQFSEPVRDRTERQLSKADSLEQQSLFQNLMFLSYACLLKLYLLYNDATKLSNTKKMINYLDFLSNEVNLMSSTHIIYGNLLLSGHPQAIKLIHPKKKTIQHFIHGIWNASLDLTFPTLVSKKFISDKKIPIFVTRDELLWLIFESMKMRYIFTSGNKSAYPPILEIDFSQFKWNLKELQEIKNHQDKIQEKRLFSFIRPTESMEERLNRLRKLCLTLENDVKKYLKENKGIK